MIDAGAGIVCYDLNENKWDKNKYYDFNYNGWGASFTMSSYKENPFIGV